MLLTTGVTPSRARSLLAVSALWAPLTSGAAPEHGAAASVPFATAVAAIADGCSTPGVDDSRDVCFSGFNALCPTGGYVAPLDCTSPMRADIVLAAYTPALTECPGCRDDGCESGGSIRETAGDEHMGVKMGKANVGFLNQIIR